jgi:hypothetical protein
MKLEEHKPDDDACAPVRRDLSLYLYGELSFDQEEAFETHVESCAECRTALERERRLHAAFDGTEVEPPASLLRTCRENLHQRLKLEAAPAAPRRGWLGTWLATLTFSPATLPGWMRPAGAVALVALGFFGARFAPAPAGGGLTSMSLAEPGAARVRFVEPSPGGRVQIVVDETRRRTLTGAPDDSRIRALLFEAVRDPNDPGLRAESLGILNAVAKTPEVRGALLWTLQHDENAGVRMKALEGLRPFARDSEVQKALAQTLLMDSNPGVRAQAIDLLTADAGGEFDRQIVGKLQELMRRESNEYIRQRSQRLLEAMNASAEIY